MGDVHWTGCGEGELWRVWGRGAVRLSRYLAIHVLGRLACSGDKIEYAPYISEAGLQQNLFFTFEKQESG